MAKCIVTGSFDPITNGHMDIINRAKEIFETVYVVMLINPEKTYMFSREERMNMLSKALKNIAIVDFYDGYTVDYCVRNAIKFIVRGIRDVESYAYEHRIDTINRELNPNISTVYLPANPDVSEISSTMIRKCLIDEKDIYSFVPKSIVDMIGDYYGKH